MIQYLLLLLLLLFLELFYFKIADRFNIIDKPNERSSHTRITLRGGGIIFPIGMILFALFYGFPYPWFLAGLIAIATVSFVDDVHSVPNRYRLLIHFAAMGAMFYQWGIFNAEYGWYVLPALILCTGIINAYNFMDGINGITAGYSAAVLIPLMLLNDRFHYIQPELLYVAFLSVGVFSFFNFRKRARCFAGDVGAVSIAFILLFACGLLIIATGDFSWVVLWSVYGVDSILTIVHRLILKENIFEAHRKHAYQLMANELKIPHVVVSLIYMGMQLLISLGAIYLPVNRWIYFMGVIALLSALYVSFKKRYYYLHEAYLLAKAQQQ